MRQDRHPIWHPTSNPFPSKGGGLALPLAVIATLCSTSVWAAELPISSVYGDELGCARHVPSDASGPSEFGGITVSASGLTGLEWGCTWAEVWEYPHSDGTGFGVQGLCGGEGIPFLEQYIIEIGRDDPAEMTLFSANGDQQWELNLCEAAPRGGGKG